MEEKDTKCTGTWCDSCSNNGCCEEQKYWDKVLDLDSSIEAKIEIKECE